MGFGQGQEPFHRFQFKDDSILDNQIKAITHVNAMTFVFDRKLQLTDKTKIAQTKLNTKAFLIGRLKQTGTKNTMHINRRPDDFLG